LGPGYVLPIPALPRAPLPRGLALRLAYQLPAREGFHARERNATRQTHRHPGV